MRHAPGLMHWTSRIGIAVLASGIGLRLEHLLNGRPLWMDEVSLSFSILSRPLHGFFRPLAERQFSPLGFLWAEWLVTRLGGAGELALRAIPFAAGVAALIGFFQLARRLLDPLAALVATTLAAVSPLLIHYSAEVKSYQFDALTAILLMHATLDLVEQGASRRALVRWTIVAVLAALFSTAAPFTVGGCALALLAIPRIRHDARALLRLAAACAPAAMIFAIQWLTVYHSQATLSWMQEFWADAFLQPSFTSAILGLAQALRDLWLWLLFGADADLYLPRKTMTVILALSVVGVVSLTRRDRTGIALLLAPVALAACAAIARLWPLTPRLLLFAAPAVFMTVAVGLATVARLAPARARTPVFAAGGLTLIVAMVLGAARELRDPPRFEPVPQVMADIGAHHGPDATVYVSARLVPACTYYSAWHPDRTRLVGDSTARACTIRGARMVLGQWPVPVGTAGGQNAVGDPPMTEEWVTRESGRVLGAATGELWLVFLRGASGAGALLPAIERAGAVPIARRRVSGITIHEYRVPVRTMPQ